MFKLTLISITAASRSRFDVSLDTRMTWDGKPCVIGSFGDSVDLANQCFIIHPGLQLIQTRNEPRTRDIVLNTHDGESYNLTTLHSLHVSPYYDVEAVLGVGFGSEFAASSSSMMMIPGQVIVNPSDPETFCSEGQITMLPVSHTMRGFVIAGFTSSISLLSSTDGSLIPIAPDSSTSLRCSLSLMFYQKTVVPLGVYRAIERIYRQLTGRIFSSAGVVCGPYLNQLPIIKFGITTRGDAGSVGADVVVYPEDYLVIDPTTGYCSSALEVGAPSSLDIGYSMVKHMGILFDYTNTRIGFCDPVDS